MTKEIKVDFEHIREDIKIIDKKTGKVILYLQIFESDDEYIIYPIGIHKRMYTIRKDMIKDE